MYLTGHFMSKQFQYGQLLIISSLTMYLYPLKIQFPMLPCWFAYAMEEQFDEWKMPKYKDIFVFDKIPRIYQQGTRKIIANATNTEILWRYLLC